MKLKYAILTASFIGMAAANAASISWTTSVAATEGGGLDTLSMGLFDTTGTLVLAENGGGGAVSFDGINFAADTHSLGTAASVYHATSILSDTGSFGAAGSASTVTITGLNLGSTYRIQALVFDGRGEAGFAGRTVEFDGVDQGQFANGTLNVDWGTGLLVTGTFVADAASVAGQTVTIEAFNGAASVGGQLNAITVYETSTVPEPSSTALLGLGGLALILRRRK